MRTSLLVACMVCVTGMFLIPSVSAQTPELNVEQSIYEKLVGKTTVAKFFGYIDDDHQGARVVLTITSPTGIVSENRIYPTSDGYFELFHTLDKYADVGMYDVSASYHDEQIGNASFDLIDNGNYSLTTQPDIQNEKSEIPSWVRSIFTWYGEDLVSEKELLLAIKFLINEKIIIVES